MSHPADYYETVAVREHPMPPVTVKLYLSKYDALRELGDNYDEVHQDHGSEAVSSIVDGTLVVLLDLEMFLSGADEVTDDDLVRIVTDLGHEAYHLAMRQMEDIGEEKPGEEEMAYHVGTITGALFQQFYDYLKAS